MLFFLYLLQLLIAIAYAGLWEDHGDCKSSWSKFAARTHDDYTTKFPYTNASDGAYVTSDLAFNYFLKGGDKWKWRHWW